MIIVFLWLSETHRIEYWAQDDIYPEGTKDNWVWKFASVRKLSLKERKDPKYGGHEHTLDMKNAKEYGQYEFQQACKDMGIIKEIEWRTQLGQK